jgi:hypothetical protein
MGKWLINYTTGDRHGPASAEEEALFQEALDSGKAFFLRDWH